MTLRPRWSKVCFASPSLRRAALPPPVRLHAPSPRLWSLPAFCGLAACDDLWKTLECTSFLSTHDIHRKRRSENCGVFSFDHRNTTDFCFNYMTRTPFQEGPSFLFVPILFSASQLISLEVAAISQTVAFSA